ncbi:MAG: hypothetical protein QNJ45_17700 [Ardenticatenaceae bacterium]|nr:hypothetical protein [Ardenticatenaceae bacterium]
MSHSIKYNFVASVSGGPSISGSGTIDVAVYSVMSVTVPAGGSTVLDASPDAAGELLIITADSYENITYTVTGGVTATLDGPHVLLGSGAVGLLNGGNPVETITFNSTATEDVEVTIMLGRDAS